MASPGVPFALAGDAPYELWSKTVIGLGMALEETGPVETPLAVSMFGDFGLLDDQGAEVRISNQRGRMVLALLCLAPGESIKREQISKLLWPGRFPQQARASLRQCLHELNRQLQPCGSDILQLSHARVAINPSRIWTDLQALEAALTNGDAPTATRLLTETASDELLSNLGTGEPLESWLAARRLQIESRLKILVARLSATLSAAGNLRAAEDLMNAWRVRENPSRRQKRNGIAVLPFKQHDQVGGEFFLAEGVVDELSAHLGNIPDIAVVGRTSVNALTGLGLTLPELAAKLNVSHLIEGMVRRTSTGVYITIQLIEGATGREIWSGRLEGTVEVFLDARQMFSRQIVANLCKALGVDVTSSVQRRMTSNREAYALYLQGRSLVQRSMSEGAAAKAIELLEQSLALDPEFAECWTALAEAHIHTAVYTPCLERVARSEQAAICAQRGLELDPGQGQALAILGIHQWTRFNPAGALECALEAFQLEPNNADVTVRLGSFLLYLGRTREALPYIEAAIEQDPVYGRNYGMLCIAHLNLGNHEAALAAGRRMVDLGMPGMHLATVEAVSGNHAGGVETYYRSRLLMGSVIIPPPGAAVMSEEARDFYWTTAARGVCSGEVEARATYCQMLDMLHAAMADPYDPSIAWPAIWMGHADLAMKLYRERIHPANMPGLMSLWTDAEPIRQIRLHPDFMSFAEDIGMVAAWEKFGWPDLMPTDPRWAQ